MSEYPTGKQLCQIEKWDCINDVRGLIDMVCYIWAYGTCGGYVKKGKNVIWLELHTFGWSGNEDIIDALRKNIMFYPMGWQKSERGGHYYFKFDLRKKKQIKK